MKKKLRLVADKVGPWIRFTDQEGRTTAIPIGSSKNIKEFVNANWPDIAQVFGIDEQEAKKDMVEALVANILSD